MSKSQLLWTTTEGAARPVAARVRPLKIVEKRMVGTIVQRSLLGTRDALMGMLLMVGSEVSRTMRGGGEVPHEGIGHGAGVDLAIDPALAHAARDQLGILRAEIEDQDALGHGPAGE